MRTVWQKRAGILQIQFRKAVFRTGAIPLPWSLPGQYGRRYPASVALNYGVSMSFDYMTPEQAHMQSGKIKERRVRYRRRAMEKLAMSEGKKENGNENLMEYDGNRLTLLSHEEALRSSISVQSHAGI